MKYPMAIALMMCSLCVRAESLQEQFVKQKEPKPPIGRDASRSHETVENEKHGIKKVMMERTACYGSCPVYSVSITINGDVEYVGVKHVPFIGTRKGKIESWYVHQLFQFISDSNYFAYQSRFSRPITDNAFVYSQVVKVDGSSKIIQNYANSAPTVIWAIEELIDATGMKARWE